MDTTKHFWDCECDIHYIHPSDECNYCVRCRARKDDQPDSRVNEVEKMLSNDGNHDFFFHDCHVWWKKEDTLAILKLGNSL